MTRSQALALEALIAFIHSVKTLDKLEQLTKPEPMVCLSVLEVQVPLLLFTLEHWERLGKDLDIDFNIPLSQIRKRRCTDEKIVEG